MISSFSWRPNLVQSSSYISPFSKISLLTKFVLILIPVEMHFSKAPLREFSTNSCFSLLTVEIKSVIFKSSSSGF